MTIQAKALWGPVQVSSVAGAIYTSPANTTTTVTRGFITNESAGAATLTLWLVRSAGARANSNIIYGAAAAGQSQFAGPSEPTILQCLAGLVLAPGDAIHAVSDTNNVLNFTGSGWLQT